MQPSVVVTASAPMRFGRFELRPVERRLLIDGQPAVLGSRAFDILVALAGRPGQMVSKSDLLDQVWHGQVVEENNIAVQINSLRKLLGSELISTVPGRGYRLVPRLKDEPITDTPDDPPVGRDTRLSTHLPLTLTPLLGRDTELAALNVMVDRHRLVCLTGAGGIGKTLLAQHLVAARQEGYAHGACWIELAQVFDAAALAGKIATALGLRLGPGEPLEQLAAAVAPLRMLVALDNAEHLIAEVARIAERLLQAAPGLTMLVTSQAPLKIGAEHVDRLGVLAVPPGPLAAQQALSYGAVALFNERAQAVDSRFRLTDANAPVVIELCRALDGMPLAIELAAARASSLGVRQVAESMHDRLRLLTVNRKRNAPDRQRTLRAALEWSHALLGECEQAVFRRLSVVAGSASLELVQQVASDPGDGPIDAWAVLDALGSLVERSLVSMLDTENDARPRYRLLESPRVLAAEKLGAAGEVGVVRGRHADAMASQFDVAWDLMFSGRVSILQWRDALAPDHDNAREAIAWVAARDPEQALRIAATLSRALPGSAHIERAALADTCEALIGPSVAPRICIRTWIEFVPILENIGQLSRSRVFAAKALEGARAAVRDGSGDDFTLYLALARVAYTSAKANDRNSAEAALAELLALEDPAWPPHRRYLGAEAEDGVAMCGNDTRRLLLATRRTLELRRAAGSIMPAALANLVDAELASGEVASAVANATSLVAELEAGRDEFNLTSARVNLTAALLAQDEPARARPVALALWPSATRFALDWAALSYLALLAALEHRPAAAAELAGCAEARCTARGTMLEINEARALERACALATQSLGATLVEQLKREGGQLRDEQIAERAFGDQADHIT